MTFKEFWPQYVLLHQHPATRLLHAIGSLAPPVFVAIAIARGSAWWLVPIPFVAYGLAWFSHFVIEHNRPATWEHFWLSLAADYRMFGLMLVGRMGAEVERIKAESGERHAVSGAAATAHRS